MVPVKRLIPSFVFLLNSLSAVGAKPDSLLALPRGQRLKALTGQYDALWRRDTLAARRQGAEWRAFFEKNGSGGDQRLLTLAEIEVFRDTPSVVPRFVAPAQALLRQAEAHRDTLVLAQLHLDFGICYYENLKKYDLAFRHYDRAFELIRHQTEAQFSGRDYSIYLIGLACYQFFDNEKAIYYGKVLHAPTLRPEEVNAAHVFNACLLGLSYLKLQRYGPARVWFEWGLQHLPLRGHDAFPNEAWVGIFKGHVGLVLLAQRRPDEALPYLQTGLDRTAPAGVWNSVATFASRLSGLYLGRGDAVRAGAYARQAHAAARRTGDPQLTYETHQALADWLEATGQPGLALRHADSAARAKDAWRAAMDVTLKHRAELAAANERHRANELLLERDRQRQVLLRNGLLVWVLLVAAIAVLLYHRRVTAYRHRQERTEADLRQAVTQLEQFRQSVQEKSALLDRLSAATRPEAVPADVLAQLQRSVLITDEGWQAFSDLFAKVHPGFSLRLREKHPGLSPADVRLLTLSKLGYSTREMAAMLGVSLNAIRQNRTRLRRKLGLPEEASIEELAANV